MIEGYHNSGPCFQRGFYLTCVTGYHRQLQVGGPGRLRKVWVKYLVLWNAFAFGFKVISIKGTFGYTKSSQGRCVAERMVIWLYLLYLGQYGRLEPLLNGIMVVFFGSKIL